MIKVFVVVVLGLVSVAGFTNEFEAFLDEIRPTAKEAAAATCAVAREGDQFQQLMGAEIMAREMRERFYRSFVKKGASEYQVGRVMGLFWLEMGRECPQFTSFVKMNYDAIEAEEQLQKMGIGF